MKSTSGSTTAAAALLSLSAIIWGFAFVAQRVGMEYVGPFAFNGVRFLLGSAALIPVLLLRRRPATSSGTRTGRVPAWIGCAIAGLVLFAAASLQQIALVTTSAGKAGFITGLYVVIVPILGVIRRHQVTRWVWIGALLAAGGTYLLSATGTFGLSVGDALLLLGALGWAIHVHVIGWLADRVRPLAVAVIQFASAGVLSLGVALLIEPVHGASLWDARWAIAYAGLLSTGVAYTLQVVGQQWMDPSRAGIILSLESAFAVLGGWLLLGETLTVRGMLGCALMLLGMLSAQIRREQKKREGISPRGEL